QIFQLMLCKGTLAEFQIELMLPQFVQNLSQISHMRLQSRTVNKDIIQKDQDKLSQEWLQNIIHKTLESGWSISHTKWHYPELVVTMMCLEGCFILIT